MPSLKFSRVYLLTDGKADSRPPGDPSVGECKRLNEAEQGISRAIFVAAVDFLDAIKVEAIDSRFRVARDDRAALLRPKRIGRVGSELQGLGCVRSPGPR